MAASNVSVSEKSGVWSDSLARTFLTYRES